MDCHSTAKEIAGLLADDLDFLHTSDHEPRQTQSRDAELFGIGGQFDACM